MTNLDSILKSRNITLPTKVHLAKAMVFSVVMYGCESWTIKKVDCWRIDAFELWCWRRFLDRKEIQPVHPEGDQSWVFIGRTDAEAEPPFGHLMQRADSLEKTPMLGGIGGRRRRGQGGWDGWMASPTRWAWVWVNSGSWWWTGRPGMLRFMGVQRVGHDWETDLTDWLTTAECRASHHADALSLHPRAASWSAGNRVELVAENGVEWWSVVFWGKKK